jgi:spore maturation protein CgeB
MNIRDRLRYKKFDNRNVKILLLSTKYFLIGEIIRSLNRMGHFLHFLMIEEKEMGKEEVMEKIIKEIIFFQPDFVLTINHLGFDMEGVLARFFASIELPFASWYVDSPTLILRPYENNRSPFLSLFLWDRDYLQDMKDLGFERCYFLPLAADEEVFCPISPPPDKTETVGYPISFVGNSMVQKVEERLEKIGFDSAFLPQFYQLSTLFMDSDTRHPHEVIQSLAKNYSCLDAIKKEDRIDFEIAITLQATLDYRLKVIQALAPLHPHIFGDAGWNDLLNGHFALHPGVSYVEGLPLLYNRSGINFNATSLQMRNGLNQRVFDVPACGSFLLTDFRQQIEELFRVGKEVICYRDEEEALDLARFFLKKESAKEKIAMAGRKRVLQEHCYTHRLDFLIERMREDYA